MTALATVYAAGVILGIVCGDARPGVRLAHAVLWPLGILALVVTLGVLVAASVIAFPLVGAALLAASVILWTLR
jgi:hypothetical protein